MKHIFVVNPAAGTADATEAVRGTLAAYDGKLDYEIYVTRGEKDATDFVKARVAEGGELRFYACGGDGTINEVASGLVGAENASLAVYPVGSGNDFIKYYGSRADFLDLDSLIDGEVKAIDVIRVDDRYSINVCNFGFDTTVARTMIAVKHKKIIGGKRAYITGVATAVIKAMKNECEVYADGEKLNDGTMLLCTVANGRYVGGAFCCAPRSDNADGMLDICLIKPISRFKFIKILPVYTEGKHLDDERFRDCIVYRRAKQVEVVAPEGFCISLDGEIVENNRFTAEVVPGAVRFVVPKKAEKIQQEAPAAVAE